ncbi:MAG TPA: hypothetical protein VM055_01885 [Novosphingobium sp.]|nr:hypothetical protein [Novosphingobium sp.]
MRPPSIQLFEKVFFAGFVIGLINLVLSWDQVNAMVADPRLQEAGVANGILIFGVVMGVVIPLLLWYFIARRASNVAKWIFVVLTAIGVFGFVSSLADPAMPKNAMLIGSAVSTALNVFAAWLLFKPDAKAWLDSRGAAGTTDPTTFE